MKGKAIISTIIVLICFYLAVINHEYYIEYKTIVLIIIIAASIYFGVCYAKRERPNRGEVPSGASSPLKPALPEEFRKEQERIPPPTINEQKGVAEKWKRKNHHHKLRQQFS